MYVHGIDVTIFWKYKCFGQSVIFGIRCHSLENTTYIVLCTHYRQQTNRPREKLITIYHHVSRLLITRQRSGAEMRSGAAGDGVHCPHTRYHDGGGLIAKQLELETKAIRRFEKVSIDSVL